MFEVKVSREFCAAHFLRDYIGKCANLHGHNWKVEIAFQSRKLSSNNLLVDFNDLWSALDKLIEVLDHQNINDLSPFDRESPTSEKLAQWFFEEIKTHLPNQSPPPSKVTVWETSDACASYWEDES